MQSRFIAGLAALEFEIISIYRLTCDNIHVSHSRYIGTTHLLGRNDGQSEVVDVLGAEANMVQALELGRRTE